MLLQNGFVDRLDAFRGYIRLNIMDGDKYKAPARSQNIDIAAHIVSDFLQAAVRQHLLGIHPAAPKGEIISEFLFQAGQIHICSGELHRA